MLKEFKKFATRGNIMDLAVGVVIGGAFQSIINSLVSDIIMPAISIFTGKVDFSEMVLTIGNASIKYGNFITAIVNFLIIAFSIFLVITYLNKFNKRMEEISLGQVEKIQKKLNINSKKNSKNNETKISEPSKKICPYCFSEINYKATRCPCCTSVLETNSSSKKD